MHLWKPLALILPAGFLLGMVGGQLAPPVMADRAAEPWRSAVQARAQSHQPTTYPPQPTAYVGGYSFAPDMSAGGPDYGSSDWEYSDAPLQTIAELDARQAALLADPDVEFAVSPPDEPAPAARLVTPSADFGPEPRTSDGELPAIW